MTGLLIALLALLGVGVTSLGAWLVARRTTSGSINTSEAASLWTEGASIRGELRLEVAGLREQLRIATESIAALIAQLRVSDAATAAAREETIRARAEIIGLQAAIAQMSVEVATGIAQVHAEVSEVKTEVTTGNAQSLAMLADNMESRRIADIPEADRTDAERGHIRGVGIREGHGGHE